MELGGDAEPVGLHVLRHGAHLFDVFMMRKENISG
jgi:hypothetical protein